MQIKNDTCYIKHHVHSRKEFVSLTHYLKVWEDGYSVDNYIIDHEDIYYEGADHHGIEPKKEDAGLCITKDQYLMWTNQIQQAKETAVRMLRKTSSLITRNLEIGDYILYIWEEDSFVDYSPFLGYSGMRIVDIKGERLLTQCVFIGKHGFNSCDEIYESDEDIQSIQNNSYFITAEAFLSTHNYMRLFCQQLLDDIKSHVEKIERIQ